MVISLNIYVGAHVLNVDHTPIYMAALLKKKVSDRKHRKNRNKIGQIEQKIKYIGAFIV